MADEKKQIDPKTKQILKTVGFCIASFLLGSLVMLWRLEGRQA